MNDLSPFSPKGREPPHNIQAEQGLLGAILLDNRVVDRLGFLEPEHFHHPLHGEIFEAISAGIRKGQRVTPVTLQTQFEGREALNEKGLTVPQYLGTLAASATTMINAPDYARAIHRLYMRREIIAACSAMIAEAYDVPVDLDPVVIINDGETHLDALRLRERHEREFTTGAAGIAQSNEHANRAYSSGQSLAGLSTGIRSLDAKMFGLEAGHLFIIGGRPSMGKTALALSIAVNVARAGVGVAFFSLEMSAKDIGFRLIAIETGISIEEQRSGNFGGEAGMRRMMEKQSQYLDRPLYIDETGGQTITQLAGKARRLCRTKSIGLLVVDYIQIMNGSLQRYGTNRTQEITEITTGLKALAKELNVPVIALSQLNRNVEQREIKRPTMADLRESGSIEQDADVVMLCHREEYYLMQSKPGTDATPAKIDEWEGKLDACAGRADVILAKNRQGSSGTVELAFDGPRTLFTDRG